MDKKRILVVGLEEKEISALKAGLGFDFLVLHHAMLPKAKLVEGRLMVESATVPDKYLAVDKVVFHGIFRDDYDFLTLLALWNGPCLPDAAGMMDLRQRIPGLARALKVSRFSATPRSMVLGGQDFYSEEVSVAKWGIWHCGEDKARFSGEWTSTEPSVIEPFIDGEAVRIMIVGDRHWQIRLTGDTWLKSIHDERSGEMELDPELLEDGRRIAQHFNLLTVGVDYMVGKDGRKHLLEVNHIPNVTVFPFMNEAYLEFGLSWIRD